jgi:hypothetical protein
VEECEAMKQASIALKEQCSRDGFPFFDISADFEDVISKAEKYLTKAQSRKGG